MKINKLPAFLLAASLFVATSCEKDLLDKTNPNAPSTSQFWKTQDDAIKGVYSCYSGIQQYACYGHSWQFITARSDESYSQSPFVDLAIFTRFIQADNNFFISSFAWNDYYRTIYRTNQVLTHVPEISMDETLKKRLLAETRFVRALMYFDLDSFFGNVPLITTESVVTTRAPQATPAQVEAQVIADLQAAIPDLPLTYSGVDKGRATKGAAQALLAKMYLQQRKWSEASALLGQIINSNTYSLVPNYLDNFTETNENNSESVFEVQYTGLPLDVGQGQDNASASEAYDRPNFFGPPIYSFSDVQPRKWLLDAYTDSTVAFAPGSTKKHLIDPRRDISIISSVNPDKFYGKTFTELGYNPSQQYWRKYLNDRTRTTPENFTSGINFRVIRYADVLLLQAEALNELGQTSAAVPLVNQVRARVGLAPLTAANFTQSSLRLQMRNERAKELAGEGQRWFDILRWGLLDNQAGIDDLKTRDVDFVNFVLGKSKLLPIPQSDIDIDPNIKQNPGY
ncbi:MULTISPECIES: RagB/SusD family nutrient uptake outer membrane protein [Hymenobacter]|uniref:RagB/SusD family nutrient uptake outer membrane protein n=1 Tax=Hymenobacter jejuensis TaxID=2502781 RepID=A0A5B8A4A9_9BACT|nr:MULTISPECIES: RagB/SusD family nutrient uptake outer membrane protein [Hymenobacter]MBC6989392.1 RagB/SusD family nutrient uptake outer membrane protein [Hymenobacter sp. BT491]QDA61423.1 RagB/SusD family nutrient uptake outer membrane protein [Hymenobacter jejuensis]